MTILHRIVTFSQADSVGLKENYNIRDKIILDCSADKHSAGHQVSGLDGPEILAVLRRSYGAMGGSRKCCAALISISGYYWSLIKDKMLFLI